MMRKLLALVALSFAMAIAGGVSISGANASPLTSTVHSLKVEQISAVEKAYYRRGYYRRGYYHRRYYHRGYYHRRYYGGYYHRRRWY
jgi:hypothetical protein